MATEAISREAQQKYPRWPIAAAKPVRVDLGPAGSGNVVNVSYGGIRVKSLAPLRRETELPLRIDVPDRSAVRCNGVVVWSKPDGAAGLRFVNLADDQKAILNTWLSELEHGASESSPQRDEFARTTAQITAMKLNNADALKLIVQRVSHLTAAIGVSIALGKAENMICLARSGEAPELGTAIRPGLGLSGECIRGRKLVVCHDAASDPRAGELKQGSALIAPLLVNGELRGLLQVFSAQTHAFDPRMIETVEKLADAAIYVTHNVMPQRRVATVTPLAKPAAPSTPTAFSAPAVVKASDSGRLKAFPFPSPNGLQPASVTPALQTGFAKPLTELAKPAEEMVPAEAAFSSLAEAIRPPAAVTTASAINPAHEISRSENRVRHVMVTMPVSYHPRRRTSAIWTLIPVAAALIALPLGIYLWRHKQPAPVMAAAPAPAAATSDAVETAVLVTPSAMPSKAVKETASTTKSSAAESSTREKKALIEKASEKEKEPEPAPLMLASGVPVALPPKVNEPDVQAPSASQLTAGTAPTIAGISLPANKAAAPKLTAPVAKPLTGGTLLQRVAPVYPRAAISQGIEGEVELQADITVRGTVENIRRISGHPLLVQAAIDAVRHWRYDPFKVDGQPVARGATITLNFKIPH